MQTFESRTIGEIALASPAATRVFEEYKIDYSCRGNTPFVDACKMAGAEPRAVEMHLIELLEVDAKSDLESIADLPLSGLISYIIEKHHGYTKRELTQLRELGEHIADSYIERHPELSAVIEILTKISEHLLPHMLKEEIVLFPYISDIETTVELGVSRRKPHFGSICNPIAMLESDHEYIRDLLVKLRSAAGGYRVPADIPAEYSGFYPRLAKLEMDLHQHIHLENNLLFVKAVDLDAKADLLSN